MRSRLPTDGGFPFSLVEPLSTSRRSAPVSTRLNLTCAEILSTTGQRLRGDPLDDWPFAAAMIQPARRPDVFGFGPQLHFVCSMRQLSRPADLMIAAWAYRHFSLLAAYFLACTIPPDIIHDVGRPCNADPN